MKLQLKSTTKICSFAIMAAFAVFASVSTATAQAVPSPEMQEVLVKTTLLSFNDANITGNYAVLHSKLSKPFRDQFSPDKLKETFKDFVEKHVIIDPIASKPLVVTTETKLDENGVMRMDGYFNTTPKKVKYKLGFIPSDGEWKAIGINVNVE